MKRAIQQTYTVTGGQITLGVQVEDAVVGLYYRARYKSSKLAYAAQAGTALTRQKIINSLGIIGQYIHYQGLRYGQSFDFMDSLPLTEKWDETPRTRVGRLR